MNGVVQTCCGFWCSVMGVVFLGFGCGVRSVVCNGCWCGCGVDDVLM